MFISIANYVLLNAHAVRAGSIDQQSTDEVETEKSDVDLERHSSRDDVDQDYIDDGIQEDADLMQNDDLESGDQDAAAVKWLKKVGDQIVD